MNHIPVLKKEIVENFAYLKEKTGYFVDGTLGMAGHSIAILENIKNQQVKVIGIDKDEEALKLATQKIDEAKFSDNFILIKDDFKNIEKILLNNKIDKIAGALLDLGVSSMQLDNRDRGFSFKAPDSKLDMRMDKDQELDANEVVNKYPEARLEYILKNYGEEKFAYRIAASICKARKHKQIDTVGDLLYAIDQAIPQRAKFNQKIHYATRTFQAIRIEVNKELENLDKSIDHMISYMEKGGRLAVITFHSLEDRIVKNKFRDLSKSCICPDNAPICICNKKASVALVTRKPIIASEEETRLNARSRSAKMRIIEKI